MNLTALAAVSSLVLCLTACTNNRDAAPREHAEQSAQPQQVEQPAHTAGSLQFSQMRATGGVKGGSAAAYVVVTNTQATPDTLVGASATVCNVTEVHEMIDVDGVKTMRAAERLEVPASGSLTLKPGGTHIMLMELHNSLRKLDTIDVVLHFARQGAVPLRVPVR